MGHRCSARAGARANPPPVSGSARRARGGEHREAAAAQPRGICLLGRVFKGKGGEGQTSSTAVGGVRARRLTIARAKGAARSRGGLSGPLPRRAAAEQPRSEGTPTCQGTDAPVHAACRHWGACVGWGKPGGAKAAQVCHGLAAGTRRPPARGNSGRHERPGGWQQQCKCSIQAQPGRDGAGRCDGGQRCARRGPPGVLPGRGRSGWLGRGAGKRGAGCVGRLHLRCAQTASRRGAGFGCVPFSAAAWSRPCMVVGVRRACFERLGRLRRERRGRRVAAAGFTEQEAGRGWPQGASHSAKARGR